MLDIKFIRANAELVKEKIAQKNADPKLIDELLTIDTDYQALQQELESLRAVRNELAAVGPHAAEQGRKVKQQIEEVNQKFTAAEGKLQELLKQVPNLPSDDTPVGKGEEENVVLREVGKPSQFSFSPLPHWELGEQLDVIDNERASKVSGARFTYLKGRLPLLEFALIQFAMSVLTNEETLGKIIQDAGLDVPAKAFVPVIPPVFIRPEIMEAMARLEPKDERYYMQADDLYLIGSAEHTLGAMHANELLPESALPLRYAGFSTSFRREAGSYGKDTKGILRLHQFDKVELESFTVAEQSLQEQDFFVAIQEYFMQQLQIPYRVVLCCTGDQGDPDARHLDIECWMPGQNAYRETHSADLMTDYQARRLKTRVKRETGNELVHTNDATAFAIGRTLIAIMENYQQEDGSISVPQVLVPYAGFEVIE